MAKPTYHRLDPPHAVDPAGLVESPILSEPADLIRKLGRLHRIVVATWDPDTECGRVHALGIVRDVDRQSAVVDWRRVKFNLHPSSQGAPKWREMSSFKFNGAVATRYRLEDHFADAFAAGNDTTASDPPAPTEAPKPVEQAAAPADPQPSKPAIRSAHSPKPQRNRVAPNGDIFEDPARGTFMGNRTSPPRWLICDLHFKRDLKEPRKYTKLFFLDEAVALAAGHRPCSTCRRDRLQAYLAAVNIDLPVQGAADLDKKLNSASTRAPIRSPITSLPDGAFVIVDDNYWVKWSGFLHRWTPAGYVNPIRLAEFPVDEATVLTPEPSLAALRNGYSAAVHSSAAQQ